MLSPADAPFVHVVFFKLPDKSAAEDKSRLLQDIDAKLRPLPTVKALWAGEPGGTKTADRFMVDEDYDVGLMVLFDDKAALEAYLGHPDHEEFASKWDTYCHVRVFDFLQD